MPLVNSADHDDITSVPLWPIKQRHLACLWRAPNSVTSPWYINRRRTPEITRWRRTKYAIKVTVIRADRKPICSLGSAGPSRRKSHFFLFLLLLLFLYSLTLPLRPPRTFAIVLQQFSRCATPVRARARGTLRSFRVFEKKNTRRGRKNKTKRGAPGSSGRADRPTDRRRGGEKSDRAV